ncbi:MAG: hypothetical protein ABIP68_03450 [Ferruginibacter sp.]
MRPEHFDPELVLHSNDKNYLSSNDFLENFTESISHLLANDFEKLIYILYRIDVNENKLKATIKENPSRPEYVIAKMIIERQIEKINSREKNKNNFSSESEEEKW